MTTAETPWFKSLNKKQWNSLFASNLGWMFDGYETYALILTIGVVLKQLLDPSLYPKIPFYAGSIIAITLLGWGIGGLIGGVLADYIGRKKMMIYSILSYSILTGLSATAQDWTTFAILSFIVGIAIGSEWATGTAMVAELWPDKHRGKGAGLMQCGLGIGFFIASLTWLYVSPLGADSWRITYVIGIIPALATLWIRSGIPESALWEEVNQKRLDAVERKKAGNVASNDRELTRFTLFDLFLNKESRKYTLIALLMSLTTTLGWWGISTWVPPYIAQEAAKSGLVAQKWASYAGMAYNFGAVLGYIGFGFLADRFGRKPIAILFFAMALLLTPVLFLWTHDLQLLLIVAAFNAFFSLGQYTWMPTWLPELYPTRMRATAVALVAGNLIVEFGGFGNSAVIVSMIYFLGLAAAPFLPETAGKALPQT